MGAVELAVNAAAGARRVRLRVRQRPRLGWAWPLTLALGVAGLLGPPPVAQAGATPSGIPALPVRAVALIEAGTGQLLRAQNADARLPIASTTKIMTALVTLQQERLGQVFTAPSYSPLAVESQIGLRAGERMTVHDLLLALMLPSANDAAHDLAVNVGHGSLSRFVALMNAEARTLGLRHTHYSTPVGLDTPGNYSSAGDLTHLAAYARAREPFFARVVATKAALLRSGDHPRYVVNRNTLLDARPWINGVKTGYTLGALNALVASGTRDGMTLISAVLGAPSEAERDGAALTALDFGFAHFHRVRAVAGGQILVRPPVSDRPGFRAQVVAGHSLVVVAARSSGVVLRVQLRRQPLAGPLAARTVVGVVRVLQGGRTLASAPLLLAASLPAVSALTHLGRFFSGWPIVGLLLLLMGTLLLLERRRRAVARRAVERAAARSRRRSGAGSPGSPSGSGPADRSPPPLTDGAA